MKIEAVDLFSCAMPQILDIGDGSQDLLLVRVAAGGHVGWGECEASPLTSIAAFVCPMSHSACKPVRDSVLGQRLDDVADIGRIGALVRENSLDLFQAPHTFSGIEIALWDLLGRRFGEPIWRLLGFPRAEPRLPYASALFGETPEETRAKAASVREHGYAAAKFGWGPYGRGGVAEDAAQVEAARDGLGPDATLLVDAGTVWGDDVEAARRRLPALEAYGVAWLEGAVRLGRPRRLPGAGGRERPGRVGRRRGEPRPGDGRADDRPRRPRLRPDRRRPDRRPRPGQAGGRLRAGSRRDLRQPHLHLPPRPQRILAALRRRPRRPPRRVPGRAEAAGRRTDRRPPPARSGWPRPPAGGARARADPRSRGGAEVPGRRRDRGRRAGALPDAGGWRVGRSALTADRRTAVRPNGIPPEARLRPRCHGTRSTSGRCNREPAGNLRRGGGGLTSTTTVRISPELVQMIEQRVESGEDESAERSLPVEQRLVFYRIDRNDVVQRILHGRQDAGRLLGGRTTSPNRRRAWEAAVA